ncbi:Elongation of fatty acids protein 3-like [Sesamum alatum]|uniref:Elongation of fatty acids protein 3-like n=1 Tax=Sesamum alatum TaxID=300844 RepID=A0AAE1Y9Q6_9LAMI|nr:Elongation of fatty acids protein 3-like [Sesamum alatum]
MKKELKSICLFSLPNSNLLSSSVSAAQSAGKNCRVLCRRCSGVSTPSEEDGVISYLHELPIGAPFRRRLPVEPRPILGFHLVLPHLFHRLLYRHRRRSSSSPPTPFTPKPRRPSLGLPAVHSLSMALISATIFAGILVSASAEIRDTRWSWRRSRTTPFQWLLCFPLGTRPSGRVFFWSYIYYLSRFLHAIRTFITILRYRNLSSFKLFNHSILIFMSFLWLEFSQSFQVLAILLTSLVYSVVYGYRFWTAIGLPRACFPFVVNCQMVLLSCNLVCHVGVLLLHFIKGGCNGIGAWLFNSVLNGAILFLFLNFYVKMHLQKRKARASGGASASASAAAGDDRQKLELVKDKES